MAESFRIRKRSKEDKKKGSYKFSDKIHPKKGIIAVIIGVFNYIILFSATYISSSSHGKGDLYLGLLGMITFFLAGLGLYIGIQSTEEKEIYYTLPIIGIVLNGILIICCVILYLVGLA